MENDNNIDIINNDNNDNDNNNDIEDIEKIRFRVRFSIFWHSFFPYYSISVNLIRIIVTISLLILYINNCINYHIYLVISIFYCLFKLVEIFAILDSKYDRDISLIFCNTYIFSLSIIFILYYSNDITDCSLRGLKDNIALFYSIDIILHICFDGFLNVIVEYIYNNRPITQDSTIFNNNTKIIEYQKPENNENENEDEGDCCSICLEEFNDKEKLIELQCKHFFHNVCIKTWLTKYSEICPYCKQNIISKNVNNNNENIEKNNTNTDVIVEIDLDNNNIERV